MPASNNKSAAPAVDGAVAILELLSTSNHSLTLSEISQRCDIPSASAYRIIQALLGKHMVSVDPARKKSYSIGAKIFQISANIYQRQNIIPFFYPVAEILKNEIHKNIFLCAPVGGNVVVIAKLDYSLNNIASLFIGQTLSMHNSAGGKAILSRMDAQFLDSYLQTDSVTDVAENKNNLQEQLLRATRLGYAVADRELGDQHSCIGAPVVNRRNEPVAAICAVVNASRLDPKEARQYSKNLIQAARQLSARIY